MGHSSGVLEHEKITFPDRMLLALAWPLDHAIRGRCEVHLQSKLFGSLRRRKGAMEHTSQVVKGDPGPPSWGRWKVYIDGEYRASSPSKKMALKLANELIESLEKKSSGGSCED